MLFNCINVTSHEIWLALFKNGTLSKKNYSESLMVAETLKKVEYLHMECYSDLLLTDGLPL